MELQPVILDTNFWLMPFEYRVDIIGGLENLFEYKPFIILLPTAVWDELKMMAGDRGAKNFIAAKSALALIEKLIEKKKVEIVSERGKADGIIMTLAIQRGAWVATNDKPMRFRLKEKEVKTIILKDKHAITLA